MKRILAALAAVVLCVSMTGCSALDYMKANRLYNKEQYAQALPLYESLQGFADSDKMASICAQKADYAAAEDFFAAGEYEQALPLYEELEMYADSPLKAIRCRYENGLRYLEKGDYAQAVTWLAPLGNYEDSADKVSLARWQWLSQSRHTLVIRDEPGDFRALSLEPEEGGALRILLERKGHLLGLPYDTQFTLTLQRGTKEADYAVSCSSTSNMTITETARGRVELTKVTAGEELQVHEFFQSVTDGVGTETTTNDVTEAIIVRAVMAESVQTLGQQLPVLLEDSGVDIAMEDLGF